MCSGSPVFATDSNLSKTNANHSSPPAASAIVIWECGAARIPKNPPSRQPPPIPANTSTPSFAVPAGLKSRSTLAPVPRSCSSCHLQSNESDGNSLAALGLESGRLSFLPTSPGLAGCRPSKPRTFLRNKMELDGMRSLGWNDTKQTGVNWARSALLIDSASSPRF